MNTLFRSRRLDRLYLALQVSQDFLPELLSVLHRLPFDGLNLTHPLKEEAARHCVGLSPEATALGAVNTLLRTPAGWRGLGTDGPGLVLALQEVARFDPAGRRSVVLGAGGAGRAAALSLLDAGAVGVALATRNLDRFQSPCFDLLRDRGVALLPARGPAIEEALVDADLLVHATPFGLGDLPDPGPEAMPWNLSPLPASCLAMDMNYRIGGPTPFLQVLPRGIRGLDGRAMLAGQAALAFEEWTGDRPGMVEVLAAAGFGSPV